MHCEGDGKREVASLPYRMIRGQGTSSRTSRLCNCELNYVTVSSIMSLRAREAVSYYRMRLLTLRCAWARYAVVPRNDRTCNDDAVRLLRSSQ